MKQANTSPGEKIFDFPRLYALKINILDKINRLSIPINPLIRGKEILDIGCGSYQSRYNPILTKRRVGIDPSRKAIEEARRLYPQSLHVVGTALKLPFKDKSFDASLLLFVLHHIPYENWGEVLKEATRVTRKTIIIYDHVRHEKPLFSFLQMSYWKIFDGGHAYLLEEEWKRVLKPFKIKEYHRVGTLFRHICFYHLEAK